jgi:hypothetical protein
MRAEQNVRTAADLYEARRAARFLLRDSYESALQPYRRVIGLVMRDKKLSVLSAALYVGQQIPPSDPIPLMCVMAAAVEMIESPASEDEAR